MTASPRTQLRRISESIVDGPFGSNLASEHYVDDGARVVRLSNIGQMSFNNDDKAFVGLDHFEQLRRHEVGAGDLLVAGLGDSNHAVGRTCLAPDGLGPALVKADCFRLRVREALADRRFVAWFLNSVDAEHQIGLGSKGATRVRATPEVVMATQIPVPPLDEQRRIADFLDDQVARIDNIVAAREKQRTLIEESRSAELNAAIEHVAVDRVRLARFARVQTGVTVDAGRVLTNPIELPYLRVANVQAGGLLLDEVKTIMLEKSQVPRSLLQDGDVLMTEGGDVDKLGRGTVWRSQIPGQVVHQNHVFAVRVDQDYLVPEFLTYVTAARAAREYFELTATKTTNLASTSASKVLALSVPYVDVLSQELLVSRVDAAMLQWAELDRVLVDSIGKMEELKRSLITAAVTGEFDVSAADGSQVPV